MNLIYVLCRRSCQPSGPDIMRNRPRSRGYKSALGPGHFVVGLNFDSSCPVQRIARIILYFLKLQLHLICTTYGRPATLRKKRYALVTYTYIL